jgi:hypothetical protein
MFLIVDRADGAFHMHPGTGSSIFNFAMCMAAFGIVALVAIFAHPASPSGSVTAMNVTAGNEVAAADASSKPAGAALHGAAPSK